MLSIGQTLKLINEARDIWPYQEDPGVGVHSFGNFDLLVTKRKADGKEKQDYNRYLLMHEEDALSMSYDWELFKENMASRPEYVEEESKMPPEKSAMYDEEEREKFRLKCKNDWDLDLTEDQISMGIIEQEKTGCSIWHNQLYPNVRKSKKKITKDNGRYEWVTRESVLWDKTIDGYRKMAAESGVFAGVDSPKFSTEPDPKGGAEDLVARVTVYRLGPDGKRHPYTGEARFGEFVQLVPEYENGKPTGRKFPNNIWSNSPNNQLAVAAERQALRKAFQDCSDGTPASAPVFDGDRHVADDTSEPAPRGESAQDHAPEPAPPAPEAETPPAPPKEEKPEGKYVGIPQSGFQDFAKYNKEERIILMAQKDGRTILALDSGQRVTVSDEGYEIDRRPRTDENKGGRKWKAGDEYYDGSKVTKTAGSKKDEWAMRLLLDSGFEVRLDRWGAEERRKKREPAPEQPSEPPAKVEHDPNTGGEVIDTTATETPKAPAAAEAHAPGNNDNVDIETITDVAMLRKHSTPLLKKWCQTVLGRKVSPKDAYAQLTGVILQKGQSMQLDDYKVLYQCLEEALEEASSSGRQAG
jgi:hypothetical protein